MVHTTCVSGKDETARTRPSITIAFLPHVGAFGIDLVGTAPG